MKIEAGRYYRTRDGRKVGPMTENAENADQWGRWSAPPQSWMDYNPVWHDCGHFWRKKEGPRDLIAEWRDEPDLTAPDYNDGKWHGWNGGECPVDPEAEIEIRWADPKESANNYRGRADHWDARCWNDPPLFGQIIAFRVTKPAPPKPREKWITGDNCVWETLDEAMAANHGIPVLYREVMP